MTALRASNRQPGSALLIRELGVRDYLPVWQAMRRFTDERDTTCTDEIWLLQHPPIFTLGQAGRREHILDPGKIPVVQTDRGGQVTYHGPGQLVIYLLLDLGRAGFGIRRLVNELEAGIIELLQRRNVHAERRDGAPGVYVGGRKIASLGLRVRRGCTYHGLSLNVSMDLEPFTRINPCGYAGLEVTQMADLGADDECDRVGIELAAILGQRIGYPLLHPSDHL